MSSSIHPEPRTIALAPFDYVFFGKGRHPMTIAFYFEQRQDFASLKAGLARALEHFYPLKGSLRSDGKGNIHIVEDISSPFGLVSFEETAPENSPELEDLAAMVLLTDPVIHELEQSLLNLRLVQLPRGSLLSASMSHGAADGFGYFFFLMSWAALTRGQGLPPPYLRREALDFGIDDDVDISNDTIFRKSGYWPLATEHFQAHCEKVTYDDIFISDAFLKAQIAEAQSAGFPDLSRNDVLTAYLFKKYASKWHAPEEHITVNTAVDYRRLFPEITPVYFGNAVCGAPLEILCREVLDSSLGALAQKIRTRIAAVDRASVQRAVRCVAGLRARGWFTETAEQGLRGWHPDSTLLVTNLSRVPLAQLDFGGGPPTRLYPRGGSRSTAVFAADGGVRALVGLRPGDGPGSVTRAD
jgi:hypothetical protein